MKDDKKSLTFPTTISNIKHMETKNIVLSTPQEIAWKKQNRIESAALDMLQVLEDIVGEAAFEGLPESKQEAIHAAIKKARGVK
jgi:uncharacterized protein YifN (PemK superfamily)